MKINLLKINGFGKIKNKEIKLNNKINLIYGKNEQGKTTTLKFLNCILYGASRNKNGKEISDFEKYKPWDGTEYSGKIIYSLVDGEQFEVYREFNKKNPKIYNKNGEDISKKFNVDKNKGIEFFYEQTGVDENTFNSSALIEQKEVILNEQNRRNIVQKISNLFSTGEENISYKKIMDKLNKKYIEEVGTERTTDRPLNIIKNNIIEIKNNIKKIEYDEENKSEIKNKIENISNQIKNNENKLILLNEITKIKKLINNEKEKINIKNNLILENKNKINLLEKNNQENKDKKINKKLLIIFLLFLIAEAINLIIIKNIKIKIIISLILIFLFVIIAIFDIYYKNKIKNEKNNKLNNEKNIINKIITEIETDINNLNNKIINDEEKEKIKIIEKYKNIINTKNIINYFNNHLNNIEEIIKNTEEENNNLKFEKYKMEIAQKNIEKNIDEKINLEEKLEGLIEEEEEILNTGNSIKLAEEILEQAYNKMKNNISPNFIKNIVNNKNEIIGEKYKNIIFNEEEGLNVELENGNYVNANLLSVGTIDQLYLSLRLAITKEISKEGLPIILDEAFAYYDDERLENILKYLNNNFENYQIIIFTCSKREKEILDRLKINYNYIEL